MNGNADKTRQEPDVITYKALDGGWGWVVCFGCFMVNVLNDGIGFSFGIVFAELLDYYKGTKAETVWIVSLSLSVAFLIDSCRTTYRRYDGLSWSKLFAILISRDVALLFYLSPIVAAFTSKFGCRVVAATGAIITFASYLISAFTPNLHFLYFSLGVLQGVGDGAIYLATIVCISQYFEQRRAFATGLTVCGAGIGTFLFSPLIAVLIEKYSWRGAILIQSGLVLNCLVCSLLFRPLQQMQIVKQEQSIPSLDDINKHAMESDRMLEEYFNENHGKCNNKTKTPIIDEIEGEHADIHSAAESGSRNKEYLNTSIETGVIVNQDLCGTDNGLLRALYNSFKESLSPDLLKNRAFALFVLSVFFYSIGYYIPFVYLPVKASDAGVDEMDAAWILSTLGITSTVGRVVFGFLSDKKWVNRLYLYNTSVVICGIASCLCPYLSSFISLLVYAAVFGTFSGASIPLTSVLITDFVGIENLSPAFGIANFVTGIATLVGPPVAGWLYDISGSYNGSFLAAGITITFSGAMLYVIPCIDKEWKRNKKK